jgi:hypothetical protein
VTVVSLSFFKAQEVGEFGERLVDYPTIDTESHRYLVLKPFIVLFVVVVVGGFPLALLLFLWRHRPLQGSAADGAEDEAAVVSAGGLEPAQVQSSSESPTVAHLIRQLTSAYRPSCWFYPSVVLLRRFVMVALLVWLSGPRTWLWCTLVNWLLLLLHFRLQPFRHLRDNAAEAMTLLCLALQTTALSLWPPPTLTVPLLLLLVLLVCGPVVWFLWRPIGPILRRVSGRAQRPLDDRHLPAEMKPLSAALIDRSLHNADL